MLIFVLSPRAFYYENKKTTWQLDMAVILCAQKRRFVLALMRIDSVDDRLRVWVASLCCEFVLRDCVASLYCEFFTNAKIHCERPVTRDNFPRNNRCEETRL